MKVVTRLTSLLPQNEMEFIDLKAQQKRLGKRLNARINKVLSHGQYIMGPEVSELEEKLAKHVETKHCITVSSGTDALLISLMALGIKQGDEVITTSFSWISTAEVIVLSGARPVFVDVDSKTCNIDSKRIEEKITHKTKAIMPVSLYGQPSEMKKINQIAAKYKIPVIEDGAQSFGATLGGKKSCNLSLIGCTSFFPSKPLGGYGDSGAIFTNDDSIAKISKEIRLNGQENKNKFNRIGIAGRMDTMQAAILLAKFEIFHDEVERRVSIGGRYDSMFDECGIEHVQLLSNTKSVYAQYTIFSSKRDYLMQELSKNGIPSAIYYASTMNNQIPYKRFGFKTKIASKCSQRVLSIPMHPYLTKRDQDKIVKIITDFES